jgi:hypothetical protein
MNPPALIITTIFEPNDVMRSIADHCRELGWAFIIAGDSKSPADFQLDGANFLSLSHQRNMGEYGKLCPEKSYARKNFAYIQAIKQGAPWIIETDDDNMPKENFWQTPDRQVAGLGVEHKGWVNAYRYFSDTFIYPRGYPIDRALPDWVDAPRAEKRGTWTCPIQQGLADENPDVDAVYRMLYPLPLNFQNASPLVLGQGSWCPFNSQNTVFFPEAYPLLYLPATCAFRMTDIWRSFIAQRILWTCGWRLSFHSATVYQERNEHILLRDFEDEISGYLGNSKIVTLLSELDLPEGPAHIYDNLKACYEVLTEAGFFRPEEMELLRAWLREIQ